MYWLKMGSVLAPALWLLLCGIWSFGGWLVATHGFRLESRERITVGFGIGLVAYLWFANMIAHWSSPLFAFTSAAFLVLFLGFAFAKLGNQRPVLPWSDLKAWPLGLAGTILGWSFFRISQGLAIFDDYVHLPLISTMAAGNIPPRYFVNSRVNFAYHYGFHLLGASMMRVGEFFVWTAFDFSKALLWAYALVLAYLLGRRFTNRPLGGMLSAGLVAFASGTRYLLLLFPVDFLQAIDKTIRFQGAELGLGTSFSESLAQVWPLDGGPPLAFPFAFLSGIGRPLVMAHAGLNILNIILLLLIWLLAGRARQPGSGLIWTALFALWGLTWETSYLPILGGYLLFSLFQRWKTRACPVGSLRYEALGALVSIPIALMQGGLLTELARKIWLGSGLTSSGAVEAAPGLAGFSLRWPPAIVSAHLGPLSLFSAPESLVALVELGPIILFAPWITIWAWRRIQTGNAIFGILAISAWIAFAIPVFFTYQSDTDISRITELAVHIWTISLGFMLWDQYGFSSGLLKTFGGVALALMAFGGFVLAGSVLSGAQDPTPTYKFNLADVKIQRDTWDRLPENSEVFDPRGWRATALTGRLTRAVTGDLSFGNQTDPVWDQLRQVPSIQGFLEAGYRFVYVDREWWGKLPESAQTALSDPCVMVVAVHLDETQKNYRRLLDLQDCAP